MHGEELSRDNFIFFNSHEWTLIIHETTHTNRVSLEQGIVPPNTKPLQGIYHLFPDKQAYRNSLLETSISLQFTFDLPAIPGNKGNSKHTKRILLHRYFNSIPAK
jgi:hypothetical protein